MSFWSNLKSLVIGDNPPPVSYQYTGRVLSTAEREKLADPPPYKLFPEGDFTCRIVSIAQDKSRSRGIAHVSILLQPLHRTETLVLHLAGSRLIEWNYFQTSGHGARVRVRHREVPPFEDAFGNKILAADVSLLDILPPEMLAMEQAEI